MVTAQAVPLISHDGKQSKHLHTSGPVTVDQQTRTLMLSCVSESSVSRIKRPTTSHCGRVELLWLRGDSALTWRQLPAPRPDYRPFSGEPNCSHLFLVPTPRKSNSLLTHMDTLLTPPPPQGFCIPAQVIVIQPSPTCFPVKCSVF